MLPAKLPDDEMRPHAIHVEQIVYDVSLRHIERRRVAVVDLEFSLDHARNLVKNLEEQLKSGPIGAIRIRFKGRMVLE